LEADRIGASLAVQGVDEMSQGVEDDCRPLLSICMATYNRGAYIAETLTSIFSQLRGDVELIVVNGNSPDDTAKVLASLVDAGHPMRVFNEVENGGVDKDYDKAVSYARGRYCWLMTDDDVLVPGAVERILAAIGAEPDLIVCNAGMWNGDLKTVIRPDFLDIGSDLTFGPGMQVAAFELVAPFLSFIGAVVVRREIWMQRSRDPYFGSLFIHVGVLFQAPMTGGVVVISEPLLRIRYGNSMWSHRTFEVWMI
jgi:glycosyltransferase involved in cell wall biosynthesis